MSATNAKSAKGGEASRLIGQGASLGVLLAEHQATQLIEYEELLRTRGLDLGVIAKGDAARVRVRHVLDCLRAVPCVRKSDRTAHDLGSGGGLPGIVLAIARPGLRVTLVESRKRRAGFLELAVELLRLDNARVSCVRVEEARGYVDPADLCMARAFAPLRDSWRLARPLLRARGRLVYFAGGRFDRTQLPKSGARARIVSSPGLASAGPLVIMDRP